MRFHPLRMGEWTEALISVKGTWFIYLLLEFRLSLKYSLRHKDYHFQKVVHPSHFSCAWFFVTLWTAAHQALLSMGFSRQEYWSGLPCPPPGDLPHPRTEPESPASAGRFFTTSVTWKACISWCQGLYFSIATFVPFLPHGISRQNNSLCSHIKAENTEDLPRTRISFVDILILFLRTLYSCLGPELDLDLETS